MKVFCATLADNGKIHIHNAYDHLLEVKDLPGRQWKKDLKVWEVVLNEEIVDRLVRAGCLIDKSIRQELEKRDRTREAVLQEKIQEKPKPLLPMPIKATPFEHQIRAFNIALRLFGLVQDEQDNTLPEQDSQALTEQQQRKSWDCDDQTEYKVKVRKYMTDGEIEFNKKFNKGIGVPLRVMFGRKVKETEKMFYLQLHGKPAPSDICLKCGKVLTHPVSLLYGIGPECGGHYHIPLFHSEKEVRENYYLLCRIMSGIRWDGWIPKRSLEYIEPASDRERMVI